MHEQTEMITPVDLESTWILTSTSRGTLLEDTYSTTFWKRLEHVSHLFA